jgi:hypothetical protein
MKAIQRWRLPLPRLRMSSRPAIELELSRASRKRAWENLAGIRWVLQELTDEFQFPRGDPFKS